MSSIGAGFWDAVGQLSQTFSQSGTNTGTSINFGTSSFVPGAPAVPGAPNVPGAPDPTAAQNPVGPVDPVDKEKEREDIIDALARSSDNLFEFIFKRTQ